MSAFSHPSTTTATGSITTHAGSSCRPPEEQNVVLIDAPTVRKAEKLIVGCESCSPEDAEIPFDNVLDRVTGNDPAVTDYILSEPAKCPHCKRDITGKTLVELAA